METSTFEMYVTYVTDEEFTEAEIKALVHMIGLQQKFDAGEVTVCGSKNDGRVTGCLIVASYEFKSEVEDNDVFSLTSLRFDLDEGTSTTVCGFIPKWVDLTTRHEA